MIFPGMDPYLENPRVWPGVHARLIVYLADQLQPQLSPRYVAAVGERVYVEGTSRQYLPDVAIERSPRPQRANGAAVAELERPLIIEVHNLEIRESFIEIIDLESDQKVVTVIEVLSPTNKAPGSGQDSYLKKQSDILTSTVPSGRNRFASSRSSCFSRAA